MRTVPFKTIIDQALQLVGTDPDKEVPASTLLALGNHINRNLRDAWLWSDWPELTDVASYETPDDATVDLGIEVDSICGIYADDPRECVWARTVDYTICGDRVQLIDAPGTVWVRYWKRVSEVSRVAYDATKTYAAGDVRYFADTGECYKALEAIAGNESPVSEDGAAKWQLQPFPLILRNFAALIGAALLQREDGQAAACADLKADALDALVNEQDNFRMRTNATQFR